MRNTLSPSRRVPYIARLQFTIGIPGGRNYIFYCTPQFHDPIIEAVTLFWIEVFEVGLNTAIFESVL